jgi:dihydrofolate synthase/folylpolyglutamate synthase
MTLDDILSRYTNNEKAASGFYKYSPDGITALLDRLGNPHLKIRTVHIAGTNGKGSVCHMLHDLFRAHGLKTGLYTSPHLETINERIVVDGGMIGNDELFAIVSKIHSIVLKENITLTWFDLLTAAAFLHFRKRGTDIAVIETGLGGTMDSTNIVDPELSIITGVSFDHMHMLGTTIEEIAANKAGIIKKGKPAVTGAVTPALDVIRKKAGETGSGLFVFGEDFEADHITENAEGISFKYHSSNAVGLPVRIPHPGTFQAINASIVLKSAEILSQRQLFRYDPVIAAEALAHTAIPGRMQLLSGTPLILFDPAHNEEALLSLAEVISQRYGGLPIKVFVCLMKDKRPAEMLDLIQRKIPGGIVYCATDDSRAFIPGSGYRTIPASDIPAIAGEIEENGLNLFTGSFRLFHTARLTADIFAGKGTSL